eukprot:15053226-Heterocapsa_arctica.AAC.1
MAVKGSIPHRPDLAFGEESVDPQTTIFSRPPAKQGLVKWGSLLGVVDSAVSRGPIALGVPEL